MSFSGSEDDYQNGDETSSEEERDNFSDDDLGAVKRPRKTEVSGHLIMELEMANQLLVPYKESKVFELDDYHLVITLPLDFINKRFREWWGLSDPCLRIRLAFNLAKYRLGDMPEATASMPYTKRNIAMGAIETFIKDDLTKYWSVRSEDEQIGDDSFFAAFIDRLVARMKELGNYCVQCGIQHLGAHPLLSVCDHPLCYFQRDRLRQTFEYSMGPRLWADSAQLLNFLFFHANDYRRSLICKPDPLDDVNLKEEFRDYGEISAALRGYCTRCVFSTWANYEKFRDDPLTKKKADLLYWLSDRFPVICRLPPRFRVNAMSTIHQYVLPPVASEKESRFQANLEAVNGKKFYAFHGSPVENWYKILCEGLVVCSGTNLQLVGAAHGKGVYLGKEPQTSEGYARGHSTCSPRYYSTNDSAVECQNTEHYSRNKHIRQGTYCLALVEVANDPSKYRDHQWCYVVQDPDILQIRVLFIYVSGSAISKLPTDNFSANHPDMLKVQEAMNFFIQGDFHERLAAVYDSELDEKALEEENLPSHRLQC
ncbi:unnamed protein product, partial [Mesorhabditis belari]|uniref:PARP catalytic domain-containing protein n=1 Tax=Mesorhabditis belari TaxID=2138241 RepID=A0AAF3JAV2_9BILA